MRYARATRAFLLGSVAIGTATAALVITQAILLGGIIAAAFQDGESLETLRPYLLALVAVIVGRACLAWASDAIAQASSASAKSQLRMAVLEHAMKLGPVWLTGARTGELVTLTTRGIDALDAYFSRYLPQLVLACIVPIAVIVTVAGQDLVAALLIAVTIPLIPLFLALIGSYTRTRVDRQWRTLAVLSGHFLDLVAGLPTLKVFDRAKAQVESITSVGERYRRTTMGVLRVSFLSALVLELIATLSVALVAVSIGLRLLGGDLTFRSGLTALLLAPEAYLPIRLVGQYFHAAAEGVGAAERVFEILETQPSARGLGRRCPDMTHTQIVLEEVSLQYAGRSDRAVDRVSAILKPGEITALAGPSGGGKSSLLSLLMGFVEPTEGRILLRSGEGDDLDLADLDADVWRTHVGYVAQSPYLGAGTVADAVRLGAPAAAEVDVQVALAQAGLDVADPTVLSGLPDGLHTAIGEAGVGLSTGQVRRVALARALCRQSPVVLLDEPTAALDGETEDAVIDSLLRLRREGRMVVIVAHRPALLGIADQVLRFHSNGEADDRSPTLEDDALVAAGSPAPVWEERA